MEDAAPVAVGHGLQQLPGVDLDEAWVQEALAAPDQLVQVERLQKVRYSGQGQGWRMETKSQRQTGVDADERGATSSESVPYSVETAQQPHATHQQLEDEGEAARWLIVQHLAQVDDVGMRRQAAQGLDLPQIVDLLDGLKRRFHALNRH